MLLGRLSGVAFGWGPLAWTGFGVGLILALAYIGYVLTTAASTRREADGRR